MIPYGPDVDFVLAALEPLPVYRDYRAGRLTRAEYAAALDANAGELLARLGGDEHLFWVAKRYPPDFDAASDAILASLVTDGFLDAIPDAPYDEYRAHVRAAYDHDTRHTSIHPDDARLAYFISMAVRPKRLLAVGSYYGYWAVWAMPGVAGAQGHAVLVDPDREVSALAERNFRALGYGDRTDVRAEPAEEVLPSIEPGLDLVLLDAADSGEHPDPSYHGKGIYGFVIEDIHERMRDGALLVVHNDMPPEDHDAGLERFHTFCTKGFRKGVVTDTPEGVGIYLK
ncbi:MAG: class I SAM-dependent methyltransferase [Verrucomicrobia bacterium]|nr:class I SAM-dependent methyltransferase [Verrucomicrobiota bacterium]